MIVATRIPKKSHEYRFYSLCHGGGKMTTEQPAVKQATRNAGEAASSCARAALFCGAPTTCAAETRQYGLN